MKRVGEKMEEIKIAYVGGGSRGWAWGLMSDLAAADDISGDVYLYDIDKEAADHNVEIGMLFNKAEGAKSTWNYHASETLADALKGANFVVISILPGTFDEMESDVHTPEKYGIYQSVGDTSGPGGILRMLRTIPMMEEIALAVKENCPDAWVINYTNPMTVSISTLYKVFPEIKAFGCCHEVFGTQKLLASLLEDKTGIKVSRDKIDVNIVGINHFTWLTEARYGNIDLFPIFEEAVKEHGETGYLKGKDDNWRNNSFTCSHRVKFDLFKRYGYIAAAGDRHLAEFCPGKWYLGSPEEVREWGFGLTTVAWRKNDLVERLEKSRKYRSGELEVKLNQTGEDGVNQIRALLGLHKMVTNVNLPNKGQTPNMPLGTVVETNAVFSSDSVLPVCSGNVPTQILSLISRVAACQETVVAAGLSRNLDLAFSAFAADPLVTVDIATARKLFDEMVNNTKKYLSSYFD